jgi:hypothetical protein
MLKFVILIFSPYTIFDEKLLKDKLILLFRTCSVGIKLFKGVFCFITQRSSIMPSRYWQNLSSLQVDMAAACSEPVASVI